MIKDVKVSCCLLWIIASFPVLAWIHIDNIDTFDTMGALFGFDGAFAEVFGEIELGQVIGAPTVAQDISPISSSSSEELESELTQQTQVAPRPWFRFNQQVCKGRYIGGY